MCFYVKRCLKRLNCALLLECEDTNEQRAVAHLPEAYEWGDGLDGVIQTKLGK